ncbi:glycosyltransferase family 2 protein [Pseudoxanthomonas helianthi]|uniref:Glycosyltransferase family 2 protein n=1 Tax=Pseudoxanthomonas helianthi TaxID=1453541 RepID=A0A940X1Z3_9GAMM|nr:glycosyltransferase family 2 protein [Pseudoxanthomonas helianthi]MBP3983140.1 glycosyltransferase family 2 protein [Pseudoxanthomonas helianthi]
MDNPLDVSVVVPVYAGAAMLPELHARITNVLESTGYSFELILVDDRGHENNWLAITSLSESDGRIVGIRLTRNYGQHAATLCGLAHATGRWVITMDEDLEHPPEAMPAMLLACKERAPLVYGVFPKRKHAWYRNLTSELMRLTLKRAFPDLNEDYTSFRAMHATLAHRLAQFDLSRPYIDGMLSWITNSVATVQVQHGERLSGESAYTLRKLISHALNIFITFSQLPLRLASYAGVVIACSSFIYMIYVLVARLMGWVTSPGYASIMSVVLFACGIQLTILGVVGEYIGRLMAAAYRKPVYVVEATARILSRRGGGGFEI